MAHHGSRARRPLIMGMAALAVVMAAILLLGAGHWPGGEPSAAAGPPGNRHSLSPLPPSPTSAAPSAPEAEEEPEENPEGTPPSSADAAPSEVPAVPQSQVLPGNQTTAGAEPGPPAGAGPGPAAADDAGLGAVDQPALPPAGLGGKPSDHAGVRVSIGAVQAVEGVAEGIGEVAGPSIRFTISVTNDTVAPMDLADAVVTVDAGADVRPAGELSGPDASPFPSQAAAGETVSGTYVFLVPMELRQLVRISLNYSPEAPIAVFEGPVPTG